MRIIAGRLRSRLLQAPPGLKTRPTSDRLRETLFNVLAPRIEGAHLLDLYAGSGAVGIEALSRGAEQVVFVERAEPALRVLRENVKRLGLQECFRIAPARVAWYLRNTAGASFDIIFLDPPYDAEDEYADTLGLLGRDAADPWSQNRDLHAADEDKSPGTLDSGRVLLRPGTVVVAEHRRKQALKDSYGMLRRTRLLEQGDAALSFYAVSESDSDRDQAKGSA